VGRIVFGQDNPASAQGQKGSGQGAGVPRILYLIQGQKQGHGGAPDTADELVKADNPGFGQPGGYSLVVTGAVSIQFVFGHVPAGDTLFPGLMDYFLQGLGFTFADKDEINGLPGLECFGYRLASGYIL
jgi:hypothetical protein